MSNLEQAAAWNAELSYKNHVQAYELANAIMTNTGDPRLLADRISSDPATAGLAHQVHAAGLVRDLRHQDAGYRYVRAASHGQRHGYGDENVPDVVHHLADEATTCHVMTGRENPGWDEPGSVSRLRMRGA